MNVIYKNEKMIPYARNEKHCSDENLNKKP